MSSDVDTSVKPLGLREIPTASISKNPQNPRMFFPEESLAVLRESIQKVGILIPLLVYESKSEKGRYVILDGERRWRCAQSLGLPTIPVNTIEEPTTITNLLTMFNIHNIREPWQVMPAALKLEVIMRILNTQSERKLSELTGLASGQIRRLKNLLAYDKKYQDIMLKSSEGDVTADFFAELQPIFSLLEAHCPRLHEKYDKDIIIEKLLAKQRKGIIQAGREFRILAQIIRATSKDNPNEKVENILERVINDPELGIRQAFELSVKEKYEAQSLRRYADNILELLSDDHPITIDEDTITTLNFLMKRISEVLASAENR